MGGRRTQQSSQTHGYDAPIAGYCRGVCGKMDGVNGRSRKDLDKAACQAACDDLGDQCIGYTHRGRDGFCSLHGSNLENNPLSGWMSRSLPTTDIATSSGHADAECVIRSLYLTKRSLPQQEGVDFKCVENERGMHAEIIGGSQDSSRRSDKDGKDDGANNEPAGKGGRGADRGEYVEYNLDTTAYEVQSDALPRCPTGLQFPAPWAEGYGYYDEEVRSFEIVDTVIVPDLPGEYLLSWRWDNEQSPQIWNNCADIIIAAVASSAHTASSTLWNRLMSSMLTFIAVTFSTMRSNSMA